MPEEDIRKLNADWLRRLVHGSLPWASLNVGLRIKRYRRSTTFDRRGIDGRLWEKRGVQSLEEVCFCVGLILSLIELNLTDFNEIFFIW